jgi:GTP pyrophosphokinase
LKFVKTQRAKSRIKQWLKVEERKKGLILGGELLEKALRRYNLSPSLAKSKEILDAARAYKIQTHEDLLVAIGYGRLSVHKIVRKLMPEPEKAETEKITLKKEVQKTEEGKGIKIKGVDNIMFHRSKCCYPLPGERVTGFVTRGRGISIHTTDCPTLESQTFDADRLVEVEWSAGDEGAYAVKVQVLTIDKRGLLAELSAVLSTNNVNINHLDASTTHEQQALFNFILDVRDKHHLNDVIKKLSQVNGVIDVKRVKT